MLSWESWLIFNMLTWWIKCFPEYSCTQHLVWWSLSRQRRHSPLISFFFFCFNLSWLGHCTRRSWFFHSVYVALEMMIEVWKAAGFPLCRSGLLIKLTAFSSDFHDERGMEMLQVGPSKIAVATFTLKWLSLYSDMVNCHQVCMPLPWRSPRQFADLKPSVLVLQQHQQTGSKMYVWCSIHLADL